MARIRLTDPGIKERLQTMLVAGTPKEQMAHNLGISKVTLYSWLHRLDSELRATVATQRDSAGAALVARQFNLLDQFAQKVTMLDAEIERLRALQQQEPSAHTALAIFRGAAVAKGYLERMGEMLGQLQPPAPATVHLTRIEQLLNVALPTEQIPEHLRAIVLPQVPSVEQTTPVIAQGGDHGPV